MPCNCTQKNDKNLRGDIVMDIVSYQEKLNRRLLKKLRNKIKKLYQKFYSQAQTPEQVIQLISKILSVLEKTEILGKIRSQGIDLEEAKTKAFLSVLGEEQCKNWREMILRELDKNLQNAVDKMQRKKRKDDFRSKVLLQQEIFMQYSLLLGADWEILQEKLDDTIN